MFWNKKKRIYMDYAATTPIDGRVLRAMNTVYEKNYFNPGGFYSDAVKAKNLVSDSRKSVAKLLGTTSDHVVFSRGGTESNNMAIVGVIEKWKRNYPSASQGLGTSPYEGEDSRLPHVIVSEIEHAAVLETVRDLEKQGVISLSLAPVDAFGILDMKEFKKLLRPETILVSVMYVNNEIGTVQPIKEITKLVRWYKKQNTPSPRRASALPLIKGETASMYPLVHTDAIQAVNYLDINVERLGVDLMSLSGSKIYGPKSSGVLYVRNLDLVSSMFHGGDQEFGLRSGTEDVAQVVGFTKALEIVRSSSERESKRLGELQTFFLEKIQQEIPNVIINGVFGAPSTRGGQGGVSSEQAHPLPPLTEGAAPLRVPNNINITIPHISGERLVIELDAKGISVSSKSACKEDNGEESHVIAAIRRAQPHPNPLLEGEGAVAADGSVRFTMGKDTTKHDVEKVILEVVKIVNKIKSFEKVLTK